MAYLLRWLLVAEAIGLLTLPLTFRVCRGLPDRGYSMAKILGLLLVSYLLWLGGTLGLLPFSAGSAAVAVIILALISTAIFTRERIAIIAWLRESRRYIISSEIIFLAALLLVAGLRSYKPEIASTEKPFEYANYNAVARSESFAPTDPWLSGKPVAYYYFGYVVADSVAKLTGTPPNYGFNVALALTAALTALAAFGLAANCAVLLHKGSALPDRWPLITGALAVALLLVIGNLEGVFELAAAHGWNSPWVYAHLGINGLQPRPSAHWWPDEPGFGSWWRATRLGSDWNFLEFPFFSFLLGDLHPHVLALPFKLLATGFGLTLLTTVDLPRPGAWRAGLSTGLAAALALGALLAIHPWDYPVFAAIFLIVVVSRYVREGRVAWRQAMGASAALIAVSALLFLPYFFGARGSVQGIQPTEAYYRAAGVLEPAAMYLPFQHLLLFWTPLMLPAALFVAWSLAERGWRPLERYGGNSVALVALLPIVWGFAVWLRHGGSGLRAEAEIRGFGWLTVVTLGVLLTAATCALLAELLDREPSASRAGRLFLLASIAMSLLLVYGPELFMVRDSSGTRANTTFKLWYSAWTLLSVAGASGGAYALWQWRPRTAAIPLFRPLFAGICAVVLGAALVYPLDAAFNRTGGFTGPTTLDGLAYLRTSNPDEYNAAAWLNQNVPDVVTVLEAVGNSYEETGRISSRTGLPTVLNWPFHEQQLRGAQPEFNQRATDVATVYQTPDEATAFQLLSAYGVRYVVVGEPERRAYGAEGLAKFAGMGTTVFRSPTVIVYRLGQAPLFAGMR